MLGSKTNSATGVGAKATLHPRDVADLLLNRANHGDAATVKEGLKLAKFCKDDVDVQGRIVLVCLATGYVGQARKLGKRIKVDDSGVAIWARAALAVGAGDVKVGTTAMGELELWFESSADARALAGGHALNAGDFLEAENFLRTVQAEHVCPAYRYPVIYAAARTTGDIAGAGSMVSSGVAGALGGAVGVALVGGLQKLAASAKTANFGSATMAFISGPHAVYKA